MAVFGSTGIRLGTGFISGFDGVYNAVEVTYADSGIYFGKLLKEFVLVALGKAAGHNDSF